MSSHDSWRKTINASRLATASLWLFRLGIVASATELLLLEHYETAWQQLPLWLLGVALITSFVPSARNERAVKAWSVVCGLMILSGLIGLFLHYRNNADFELEMHPTLAGLPLFWAAIRGAVPALAPGTMIYLGGLGLLSVRLSEFHHAASGRPEGRN